MEKKIETKVTKARLRKGLCTPKQYVNRACYLHARLFADQLRGLDKEMQRSILVSVGTWIASTIPSCSEAPYED